MKHKLIQIGSGCLFVLGAIGTVKSILGNETPIYMGICISVLSISIIIFITVLVKELCKPRLILQCNSLGITEIYYQREPSKNGQLLEEWIADAQRIDLFFTIGVAFFNTYQWIILDAMNKNRTAIRVILGKKHTPFLNAVGEMEIEDGCIDNTQNINTELDLVEELIRTLRTRAGNNGRIELRHFETEFRTSMILIESAKKECRGLITITTPPLKAAESVAFVVKDTKHEKTIYKQCKKHFNCVWKRIDNDT